VTRQGSRQDSRLGSICDRGPKNRLRNGRARLSLLWVFAILNYLYCDLLGLMDPASIKQLLAGTVAGLQVTQGFLLGAALLMEIPIAMVLLARVLPHRGSRWANILAGAVMTLVQIGALFMGSGPTVYYAFFSAVEIACTAFIVWYAWRWHQHQQGVPIPDPAPGFRVFCRSGAVPPQGFEPVFRPTAAADYGQEPRRFGDF
jgi:MFS family permease